uniref:Uncharacterized protein n=1 Tax=Cacopsylla melanoneura TaxID=428564 RepID=A0A8D9EP14_9HEMI
MKFFLDRYLHFLEIIYSRKIVIQYSVSQRSISKSPQFPHKPVQEIFNLGVSDFWYTLYSKSEGAFGFSIVANKEIQRRREFVYCCLFCRNETEKSLYLVWKVW